MNNLISSVVRSEEELLQIHQLNKENLRSITKSEEQKKEGFVSWLYPPQLLKQMHELAPSIVVKDDNKIAGYALVASKEMIAFHADLQTLFSHLSRVQYKNQPLSDFSFYCMGQICIDKNYRGLGLVNMLYQKHKEVYGDRYQLLVTEISTSNIRSQKAHEKIGFKTIHTYRDQQDEWNVVVWDWEDRKY
ncbi:MAG: GNAT family N-acetyltransferase [Bacteroidetes bacterium]|nr:GNAT family N-acetyltransferase [Bacteroidota bacterium]